MSIHPEETRTTNVPAPASPPLSPSQLAALAEIGEERSAPAGELLYRVGDRVYPFVTTLEGEVAIVEAARNELVRQSQTVFPIAKIDLLPLRAQFPAPPENRTVV